MPRFVVLMFAVDLGLSGWMALQRVSWLAGILFFPAGPADGTRMLLFLGLLADLLGLLLAGAADILALLWRSRWAVRLGLTAAAIVLALRGVLLVLVFADLAPTHDMERFYQGILIGFLLLSLAYNTAWGWAVWRFRQWQNTAGPTDGSAGGDAEGE